jgi:hypothetical protein
MRTCILLKSQVKSSDLLRSIEIELLDDHLQLRGTSVPYIYMTL